MAHGHDMSEEQAWNAVLSRDQAFDGRFVTGVHSTGIYCRPSCSARHPRRENVRFYAGGEDARAAGLRPCLRCRPDDLRRDEAAIVQALDWLRRGGGALTLDRLARETGYSPGHFQRLFKRAVGLSPAAYLRALKLERASEALSAGESVTDAVYAAGYGAPSRFYEASEGRLGMAPSAWRDGGKGVTIRWAIVPHHSVRCSWLPRTKAYAV